MGIIVISFVLMLVVVTIMAVGAIFANKPIKGSCGGLSALGLKESCMICGGDEEEWKKEAEVIGKANLAYDAATNPAPKQC